MVGVRYSSETQASRQSFLVASLCTLVTPKRYDMDRGFLSQRISLHPTNTAPITYNRHVLPHHLSCTLQLHPACQHHPKRATGTSWPTMLPMLPLTPPSTHTPSFHALIPSAPRISSRRSARIRKVVVLVGNCSTAKSIIAGSARRRMAW